MMILRPTGVQRLDEVRPRAGVKAVKVCLRTGAPQPCRLMEPARVRRRGERSKARMARNIGSRVRGERGRAVVQEHVPPPGAGVAAGQPGAGVQDVRRVIGLQTTAPPRALIDVEGDKACDGPLPPLRALRRPIRRKVERLLETGHTCAVPKTAGVCRDILKQRQAL